MKRKAIALLVISSLMVTMLTGCSLPSIYDMLNDFAAQYGSDDTVDAENDDTDDDDSNDNGINDDNDGNPNEGDGTNNPSIYSDDGIVFAGPNTVREDMFFYVEHNSYDITYEEALEIVGNEQDYSILGAYAYPLLNSKCSDDANYMILSNKAIEYAIYEQNIFGVVSSDYESVVPVYVTCFNGNTELFCKNLGAFTGVYFTYDETNPFYKVDDSKKEEIYNGLLANYGEALAEEYYANYLKILDTPFVECIYLSADSYSGEMEDIVGYGGTYFLEVDENGEGSLFIADVMIDTNTYEMSVQSPDYWLEYSIKIAEKGDSYILTYESGFSLCLEKTTDDYLIGYVDSEEKAFHDIVGIELSSQDYYYPYCNNAGHDSYYELEAALSEAKIILRDGTVALNPSFTFEDGNRITISFEAVYDYDLEEEIPRHFSFTAGYGLIGYAHENNSGFALSDETGTYYFSYSRSEYCCTKLDEEYVAEHSFEENMSEISRLSEVAAEDYDDTQEEEYVWGSDGNVFEL